MTGLKINMVPIGEGGFGQVFRATARENKTVAIKLMQRNTVTQEIAIMNEVQALKAAKGSPWAVELVYYQAVAEQALLGLVSSIFGLRDFFATNCWNCRPISPEVICTAIGNAQVFVWSLVPRYSISLSSYVAICIGLLHNALYRSRFSPSMTSIVAG
jgi:serine/threonine protein kinase